MSRESDVEFLQRLVRLRTSDPPPTKISEWVQGRRILPSNTPFPGLWSNDKTPYAVEIMDNMSPSSFVQHTVVMKGAQLGLTAAAENVIGFWMGPSPSEILYMSATQELLERWATKRLEPMIDSLDIRERIYANTAPDGSRRSGDKLLSKQFLGGSLEMASAQSASSMRSDSKRILVRDEIDGAPKLLSSGEGNWLDVSMARTYGWGNRKKILDFTTPTTFAESAIWPEFLAGDQRKYFVPCPLCGAEIELEWNPDGHDGLKSDKTAGLITDAYYLCPHCHDAIFNHHKTQMLTAGAWRPTVENTKSEYRSYHISSLYSPQGMLSWKDLYQAYEKSNESPDGARSFTNIILGMPYQETGARPRIDRVIELQGSYSKGTVPYGVLYLTMGIDVQRGSDKNSKEPPRLECQVMGFGAGYRMWSIDYQVFTGDIDDPYSGAWEKLNQWSLDTALSYTDRHGQVFSVRIVFIDAGDGMYTNNVAAFCERWQETYPSMGFSAIKRRKTESPDDDIQSAGDIKRYRMARIGNGESWYYQISTNHYKQNIYGRLNSMVRIPGPIQKPGFIDFPVDYDENYFKMLTAEDRLSDGTFRAAGRRNESLDTMVYAMCASDVFLDREVAHVSDIIRRKAKNRTVAPEEIKKFVLRKLSETVSVEFPFGQNLAKI
jgi:phage terminase large subunit GpA-like protein